MPQLRCCITCRRIAEKSEFWRVVRTFPDREIKINQGQGRSAYLCKTEQCLQLAEKKDRVSRALKTPIAKTIYHTLKQELLCPSPSPQLPQPDSSKTRHDP